MTNSRDGVHTVLFWKHKFSIIKCVFSKRNISRERAYFQLQDFFCFSYVVIDFFRSRKINVIEKRQGQIRHIIFLIKQIQCNETGTVVIDKKRYHKCDIVTVIYHCRFHWAKCFSLLFAFAADFLQKSVLLKLPGMNTHGADLCLNYYLASRYRMCCVIIVLVERRCTGCTIK